MAHEPNSATMAFLAQDGCSVHISCIDPVCEPNQRMIRYYGRSLTAAEAASKWGPDMTLAEIQARWRCPVCRQRGANVYVDIGIPTEAFAKMGLC